MESLLSMEATHISFLKAKASSPLGVHMGMVIADSKTS